MIIKKTPKATEFDFKGFWVKSLYDIHIQYSQKKFINVCTNTQG